MGKASKFYSNNTGYRSQIFRYKKSIVSGINRVNISIAIKLYNEKESELKNPGKISAGEKTGRGSWVEAMKRSLVRIDYSSKKCHKSFLSHN